MDFIVIDPKTGQPPVEKELLKCEWAHGLGTRTEGFALTEYGGLLLLDTCGNFAYVPRDLFKVYYSQD